MQVVCCLCYFDTSFRTLCATRERRQKCAFWNSFGVCLFLNKNELLVDWPSEVAVGAVGAVREGSCRSEIVNCSTPVVCLRFLSSSFSLLGQLRPENKYGKSSPLRLRERKHIPKDFDKWP